jgi:hypothetical protein
MLEEREKQALRSAMIEERSHFCTLFTLLKPVMVKEIFPGNLIIEKLIFSSGCRNFSCI